MPNPVVHCEIMAGNNVEAVRRFYADVFKWTVDAGNPVQYGVVTPVAPGIGGGIAEARSGQRSTTVYAHADDLPATLARVEAHGGTIGLVRPWM
jgi:predicted enzyme related to lactoylglutathione lyase